MLRTMQRLGNTGEVIYYYPEEGVIDLAYIVNVLPKSDHVDIYILYSQNKLIAIEVQTVNEVDPIDDILITECYELDSKIICDYCVIQEAEYILKRD